MFRVANGVGTRIDINVPVGEGEVWAVVARALIDARIRGRLPGDTWLWFLAVQALIKSSRLDASCRRQLERDSLDPGPLGSFVSRFLPRSDCALLQYVVPERVTTALVDAALATAVTVLTGQRRQARRAISFVFADQGGSFETVTVNWEFADVMTLALGRCLRSCWGKVRRCKHQGARRCTIYFPASTSKARCIRHQKAFRLKQLERYRIKRRTAGRGRDRHS